MENKPWSRNISTVGELKKIIEELPDETELVLYNPYADFLGGETAQPIVSVNTHWIGALTFEIDVEVIKETTATRRQILSHLSLGESVVIAGTQNIVSGLASYVGQREGKKYATSKIEKDLYRVTRTA